MKLLLSIIIFILVNKFTNPQVPVMSVSEWLQIELPERQKEPDFQFINR